jgi:hypothetical protein
MESYLTKPPNGFLETSSSYKTQKQFSKNHKGVGDIMGPSTPTLEK